MRTGGDGGVIRGQTPLSKDEVFDVFSNERRRLVFAHLKRRGADGPVDLSRLSTRITAVETGVSPGQVSYDDRKSVHTTLRQFHLPKMDDAGIVSFDRGTGRVRLTEAGRELTVYVEAVPENETSWAAYFTSMSGLTTATVLAVWLGIPAGDLFSDIGWAVAASVTLFVSSLVYLYRSWYGMRVGHGEPRTLEG